MERLAANVSLTSHALKVCDSQQPPGFLKSFKKISNTTNSSNAAKTETLKQKRAMQIATAPGKNLFMTAFMMYMSGSGVQIFSIMITGMALFTPIKAMFSINSTFASVSGPNVDLLQAKLTFIGLNILGLCMALYKCGTMGLLPLTSADWIFLLPLKIPVETSAAMAF